MKNKILFLTLLSFFFHLITSMSFAQENHLHISTLKLNKKEKKSFNIRDSSLVITIDTLLMKDRSALNFFGKKEVTLTIKYAEIGYGATIYGSDGKNNGSNMNLTINFQKLGSLFILAKGDNAINGTRTFPNGNGGKIILNLTKNSLVPQMTNKKDKNFLLVDVQAGGKNVVPQNDLNNIYDQIRRAPSGLRGVPQGRIYSGSEGNEGSFVLNK